MTIWGFSYTQISPCSLANIFHSFCSPPYLLTVFVGEQAFFLAFGQVVKDI